jgi:hypothetical protein
LIKKDFGFATETPLPDQLYTISASNSWFGGKTMYVSKDYLYFKSPYTGNWTMGATPGDALDRYDPANFTIFAPIGQMLGPAVSVMANADNVSIQSIASTATDNVLRVVGRKTDDADLVKVYGSISELGVLTWAAQKSTTYSPVTIVKL